MQIFSASIDHKTTEEILFTDYGISGPAAMQVSRVAADWERQKRGDCVAILDLFPEREEQELFTLLKRRTSLPGRTCENFLTGFLNKRVGQTLLRSIGKSPRSRCLLPWFHSTN